MEIKAFGFVLLFECLGTMFFIPFIEMGNIFKMNRAMTMLKHDLTRFGYIFIDERCAEDFISVKNSIHTFLKTL
ncbi:hypothetical protein BSBH6_01490 [Bacillus subtilis]|nr:hypothetical protein BSBH6_01490 [Bacillus subtilis]RPK16958.1 hypothetical protein BH5_01482 [Bacillus subtilis]